LEKLGWKMRYLFNFIFIVQFSTPAFAGVFNDKIHFFEPEPRAEKQEKAEEKKAPKADFQWKTFLNPEKDEFFKEGDYTPPAPFMEVMRRPTPENILLFEKWQQTKNLLLERYEGERTRVLGGKAPSIAGASQAPQVKADLARFRFIFYFDGNCPHCKAMFQTINQMLERGIYVEAVRIDQGQDQIRGLNIPWTFAKPNEVKANAVTAVPLLMAFDERSKKVFRLTGKKSMDEISKLIGSSRG
jgi:hypothetical protein